MNLTLQRATENDWQEIEEFEQAAASKVFHAISGEKQARDYIKTNEVYFINFENKKVGALAYCKEDDGYYISELITNKDYQRKGIGLAAMELALKQIGDVKAWLVTHPENSAAIGLYSKLGFKITAWKEDYFKDGEPRLVLIRE